MTARLLICAFVIGTLTAFAACSKVPTQTTEGLGSHAISGHHNAPEGTRVQQCLFLVTIGGHRLVFASTSSHPESRDKCLKMNDGDAITVTKISTPQKNKAPATEFTGERDEVKFFLR